LAQLIGITGGIGAGKSTLLEILRRMGKRVVDADNVVHELYAGDEQVWEALRLRWGKAAFLADGRVNCQAIAAKVFASDLEMRWLNELLHPLVKRKIMSVAEQGAGPCFCAVPLLFEVGWEYEMESTVALWCNRETQKRRLLQRGWSVADIEARLGAQMTMDEKLAKADFGLVNNGTLALLREQCRLLLSRIDKEDIA
jgi:dephospho-CoA kinase